MSEPTKHVEPEIIESGLPKGGLRLLNNDDAETSDADDGPEEKEADTRSFLHGWVDLFLRVALLFGALFSAYQYMVAREETRISRTLDLVETWERDEYQTAQRALRDRLAALNAKYGELVTDKSTEKEIAVYQSRLGLEALAEGGGTMALGEFNGHFDRLVYFFNRLSACVNGNLCSRPVADDFFRDFAVSFWRYFSAHFEAERKRGQPTYGVAIETYVKAEP